MNWTDLKWSNIDYLYNPSYKEDRINAAKERAKSLDGECLTDEYVNSTTRLTIRCKFDHIWNPTYNNFMFTNGGTWCPKCRSRQFKR